MTWHQEINGSYSQPDMSELILQFVPPFEKTVLCGKVLGNWVFICDEEYFKNIQQNV